MKTNYVASLAYRNHIDEFCRDMHSVCGVKYIVLYFLFKNGEKFVISNIYSHLDDYYSNKYHTHDNSFNLGNFQLEGYFLCHDDFGISAEYSEILRLKYGIYRAFYKCFLIPECTIVVGAASGRPIDNYSHFYQKTSCGLQKFSFKFINHISPIIKSHNPMFRNSIFLNDEKYLERSLSTHQDNLLSNRETTCLFLAAKGHSTKETADIMGISMYTAEDFRKSILKKLGCRNITNAVYVAITEGLIGCQNSNFLGHQYDNNIMTYRNLILPH